MKKIFPVVTWIHFITEWEKAGTPGGNTFREGAAASALASPRPTVRVHHAVVLRAEDEKSFCTQLSALSTYAFMCTHVRLYAYKDAYM